MSEDEPTETDLLKTLYLQRERHRRWDRLQPSGMDRIAQDYGPVTAAETLLFTPLLLYHLAVHGWTGTTTLAAMAWTVTAITTAWWLWDLYVDRQVDNLLTEIDQQRGDPGGTD